MSMPFFLAGGGRRLFELFGIPVRISWSFYVVAFLIAVAESQYFAPGILGLPLALISVLLLFASVAAHEFGHALCARAFGISTESITLHLLGGVAQIRSEPRTAKAELAIAAAGPAVSLVLGGIGTAILQVLEGIAAPKLLLVYASTFAWSNLALGIFNLLPGLPLDGGRILRGVIWLTTSKREQATLVAARGGEIVGFGLMGLGLLAILQGAGFPFMLLALGWYIVSAARNERRRILMPAVHGGGPFANVRTPFGVFRTFVMRWPPPGQAAPPRQEPRVRDAEFVVRYPDGRTFTNRDDDRV